MKIKSLKDYYNLKGYLKDGDNKYIKKYTTNGFIKAIEMWQKYSHNSLVDFIADFEKDYNETFLKRNCEKCCLEMKQNGSNISQEILYDILLRRLIFDTYIGFKAEETIEKSLNKVGIVTHNENALPEYYQKKLDVFCNVDIIAFLDGTIWHLIQVKNASTFEYDGQYIKEKRAKFREKEKLANDIINNVKYYKIQYYIYDKQSFIDNEEFMFYVNPHTNKLSFTIDELIDNNGNMIICLKNLKTRKL